MKWVKMAAVIVVFIVAMYFAYQSFESSFNPRRGHEHESGQHAMTPAMIEMMKRSNQKKKDSTDKKASAESPGKNNSKDAASHEGPAPEQKRKNGGE